MRPATRSRLPVASTVLCRTLLCLALPGVAPVVALAGPEAPALSITASSALGRGVLTIPLEALQAPSGPDAWLNPGAAEFRSDDGHLIAALGAGRLATLGASAIDLAFSVAAGSADTTFEITSALLSFPTIARAEGKASAALTLTDGNGDGAWIAGQQADGQAVFSALLNGFEKDGTTFATLLGPLTAGAYSSASVDDVYPSGTRFEPIGPAWDMSLDLRFTLSAFDSASGTANFAVRSSSLEVPEPSTLAWLMLLMAGPRLRRRIERV